ncbi:CPBP family intramembrane glutamic endopeptidase [Streptomyces sp. NBC_01264]|uniref:CPBP family intramembrane glutamic endopeptidase n=1 Tax=Streptomyces sp. NBC_01264 TaxID=2903804 RepID=UPI0022591CDB|nr:type II CAAX endopeptidase family protein [Streptomyces sp. NBC_01264]MCX4780330.1 CPBP family intramembrane metalloprotease [Streptomyces sp. NBC_01264]
MAHPVDDGPVTSRRGFFDRPTLGKAVLVIAGYLAYYLLVGRAIGAVFGDEVDQDDVLATGASIFFALVLPIAIGAVTLLGFSAAIGRLRSVFARRTAVGRPWMWIGPALALIAVVGHAAATDWSIWRPEQILLIALLGVCVGLAEELATRGLAVELLRGAGHSERFVMVVSSLLFALMHGSNVLSGMKVGTVLVTVVYTFGFGVCMYLVMRLTGTIWSAIVLHALTDPTTIFSSGGVDEAVTPHTGGWSLLASTATILMVVFACVAVFLVRGDRPGRADSPGLSDGGGAACRR